jgi:Tol biopolymer transport system component
MLALFLCPPASAQVMGPTWLKTAGDGTKAVFVTESALVAEDNNNTRDVYVHDFSSGTNTLVSVSTGGASGNDVSHLPLISADGNRVVFFSYASDLVLGGPGFGTYVRDIPSATTTLLWSANFPVPEAMSPDARFVVIRTAVGSNDHDLLLLDLSTGSVEQVDLNNAGAPMSPSYGYDQVAISADGRYVAFDSYASNVDPLDTDIIRSVYVRDRLLGVTFLASEQAGTNLGVAGSSISISRDGRFLAFGTYSDTVWVRELATSTVFNVTSSAPTTGYCSKFAVSAFSDDGSRLLLTEDYFSTNFPGQGCTNLWHRGLLIDLTTHPFQYTEVPAEGAGSQQRDLSPDGQWLVAITPGSQLVRSFVPATAPSPWFYCAGKLNSLSCVPHATFTGLASLSGAAHLAVSASDLRNQTSALLLWGHGRQSTPFFGGTLCVTPPLHRTPLQNTGGSSGGVHDCSGTLAFDFDDTYLAAHALSVGTAIDAQIYARDPGFALPNNVQLTSAVEFVVVP